MGTEMNQASIVGWGETEFGVLDDRSYAELVQEAAYSALEDASLKPADVDGLCVAPDVYRGIELAEMVAAELGILPGLSYGTTYPLGGASHIQYLAQAAQAINSGMCENVLLLAVGKPASGLETSDADATEAMSRGGTEFEVPYGPLIPSQYALAARAHMNRYGTTERQLARIASIQYRFASNQREERVQIHEPKSVDEVLESPMIATPLTLDQCSLITDGGAALVVTSRDRARADYENPVEILSVAGYHTHDQIREMEDLTTTGARQAGKRAFEDAGVTHDDLDVIMIYDCFTNTVLTVLEDLGFCDKGEGGALVESGELEPGGSWPMNTHGGELAQAHPISAGGMMHITEAVRQLRGEAEAMQVDDARTALVHGNGGILSTQTVTILQRGH